jgi:hypothetical protein
VPYIDAYDPTRETRRLRIANVIIRPEDVRNLARIIVRAGESAPGQSSTKRQSFVVHAVDDSQYDSGTPEIFADGAILDKKQVHAIEMSFSDYSANSRISINLAQEAHLSGRSRIEVSGADSTWVNGNMRLMEDAVETWEHQAVWPRNFRWAIQILAAFGIGRVFQLIEWFILAHFVPVKPISPRPQWADALRPLVPILDWGGAFLLGIWPAILLTQKLMKLWPSVELRMGREWAQVTRRRRQYLWLVFTIGIVPILLSILYDLIKSSWTH